MTLSKAWKVAPVSPLTIPPDVTGSLLPPTAAKRVKGLAPPGPGGPGGNGGKGKTVCWDPGPTPPAAPGRNGALGRNTASGFFGWISDFSEDGGSWWRVKEGPPPYGWSPPG